MVWGSDARMSLTGAQAAVVGGGNAIAAAASAVSLYGTNGRADTVAGAYDTLTLVSAQAILQGAHDNVYFYGNSALTAMGTNDAFYFGATLGQATLTGFNSSDTLHLSAADWTNFNALLMSGDVTQVGADTVIRTDAQNAITLTGVQASSLAAGQFVFA